MRKKTLQELMKERANQSTDTSAYTEKEMPKSTQQRYIMPQEQSTWNKIQERANQILNNTFSTFSNNKNFTRFNYERQQHEDRLSGKYINNIQNNFLPTREGLKQQNQYFGKGNIDLNNRKIAKNEDGSISTVRSMSFYDDKEKKEILVPTVINGKVVSDDEAIDHYYNTGEYLGKFDTVKEANQYAENLHNEQEKQYSVINNPILAKADEINNLYNKNIINRVSNKVSDTLQKTLQTPENLKNGYQFGDLSTTAMSTLLGGTAHVIEGVKSVGDAIANHGAYAVASVADITGNHDFSERLINAIQLNKEDTENITQKINNIFDKSSILGETGNKALESYGQSKVFGILGEKSKALEEAGKVKQSKAMKAFADSLVYTMGANAGFDEAYNQANTTGWEAILKATGGGLSSYISENINDVFGYGGNKVTKNVKEKFENVFKSGMAKAFAKLGFSSISEGAEEIVEDFLNTKVVNNIVNKVIEEKKYNTEINLEDSIENAVIAMVSVWAGGTPTTIQEGRQIQRNQEIINNSNLTDEQKTNLTQFAEEKNLNNEQIQKAIEMTENQATTMQNKAVLNQEQQTIQQEGKQAQNQLSQETGNIEQKNIKKQENTIENNIKPFKELVEKAKYIPQEEKNKLLKEVDSKSSLDEFKNLVNDMNNVYKEENTLNTKETYSTGRKEKYQKYLNSKTKYDNSALKNAMEIIPANNQGRRTKEQWLNVAKQIGTEIADKSNAEIEEIAFRSWQDERPSSKESLNRQGNKFVGFNSDEWINAIYDSVNEQRQYSVDTEQQAENQAEQQENVEQEQEVIEEEKQDNVKEEKINLMPKKKVESQETKQRKHYKSIIESSQTSAEAKKIAKQLLGSDTYVPDSNKAQLERADQRIGSNPDKELDVLTSKIDNGDKLNATDIAVSERLIEYYSKIGNEEKLQTAIQNTALAGTQLGQAVQALSLINRQTPIGQVSYIERCVKKLNQEILDKKGYTLRDGQVFDRKGNDVTNKVDLFNFTSDMQQKILNSNKENFDSILDEIYEELGNQVSKSTHQKIDSWRYFAMLGNVKTHNRNIIGNIAMGKTQRVKDKIAGGIEDIVSVFNSNMERTKTLRFTNKETKQFAKNDIKNVATELGLDSNKYTAQNRLKDNMREFKSDMLNNTLAKLYEFNNTMLEVEDGWGLKSAYVKAFGDYITANRLNVNNISDTNLRKARKYAINQAQEATFHQASALASAINQFSARTTAGKAVTDAILPFIKTPINVAKTGLEYNPAGLIYNSVKGIHDLNTGKITVNQYIDNVSKGLTGTGIALLGYALAEAGIVKASGGDDDKEKYEQERGSQAYSIKIGDNTYTLDWLAPVGIPFFVGVEAHEIINSKKEEKTSLSTDDDSLYKQGIQSATNLLNALATSMNPTAEMSMISGLTSTLRSFEQGVGNMMGSLLSNAGKSYINQFVPTSLGQVARVTDDKQRSTTSTATGILGKAVDQTKNQIMAKIPGLRQKLPVATDIWGQEKQNDDNITRRAFETFIAPYTRKDLKTSRVDSELNDLYDKTGDDSIYPDKIDKKLSINEQDYRLTNTEYIKYSKDYGQNSYNIISNLVTSNSYQGLTNKEKEEAIKNAYSYAKEVNKINYANKVNNEFETSTLYNVMSNIPSDSEKSKYLIYLSEMSKDDIKAIDKKRYILNSNMKTSTKEAIYQNSLGKNDKLYQTLYSIDKVNIDAYLDYSVQEISADEDEKSNIEGKTISGSRKNNMVDYFNSSNLSLFDKLYIYGKSYKLDSRERQIVNNGIQNSKLTSDEKKEAYKGLSSSNIVKYKDGNIAWK